MSALPAESRALERLVRELPSFATAQDVSEQARAVLHWISDEALSSSIAGKPVAVDPATCPNCGLLATSERTPYCSECCREEAAFVRQTRSALADGLIFDPERQLALGQKLWRLLGGGLPYRESLIPPTTREKVMARTDGLCALCQLPARTIEHIGTG